MCLWDVCLKDGEQNDDNYKRYIIYKKLKHTLSLSLPQKRTMHEGHSNCFWVPKQHVPVLSANQAGIKGVSIWVFMYLSICMSRVRLSECLFVGAQEFLEVAGSCGWLAALADSMQEDFLGLVKHASIETKVIFLCPQCALQSGLQCFILILLNVQPRFIQAQNKLFRLLQ